MVDSLIRNAQENYFITNHWINMSFDKNKIIQSFGLHRFGSKGWYNSKTLVCPVCGRYDKFGIHFEHDKVHCFYDNYRSNIKFFLIKIDRRDLLTGEESSITFEFPVFSKKKEETIESIKLPIKRLPIGFKRIKNDDYLNERNFLNYHYEMFRVGETRLDPSLKNHLIFQFFNGNGECVAWMSRSRNSKEWHKDNLEKHKLGVCDLILRYGNSPNTDFSKILGGEGEITENTHILIVVEGIMDKTSVDKKLELLENEGIKCVFTFGNNISEEQIKILNKYKNICTVYLLYDYNTIEESKHAGMVINNNTDKQVGVCQIKQKDKDPGDLDVEQILECLYKSVDSFEFNFSVINGISK